MHGERVYSIGTFTGGGEIADNGRDARSADASFLVLRGNADPTVTEWAGAPRPHLRMGIDPRELVPSEEFDALFDVDTATGRPTGSGELDAPAVDARVPAGTLPMRPASPCPWPEAPSSRMIPARRRDPERPPTRGTS